MRITHVIRSLDPKTGGPPFVVCGLAAAQAELGHEVSILFDDAALGRSSTSKLRESTPNLALVTTENLTGRSHRLSEALASSDFLHLHGLWCDLVRRAASTARSLDLAYAIAPHGTLGTWSLAQKSLKKRLALRLHYRGILERARFVHVNSDHEESSTRRVVPRSIVERLPHGLDPDQLVGLPDPEAFFAHFPELTGKKLILFLSRIAPVKAPELLVAAFGKLGNEHANVHLVIAGPDGGAEEMARRALSGLSENVRARVHFVGALFGRDKYAAFRACTIYCLPSRYESFGVVLLEAMAAGAPIVLSETCHFPEIAEVGAGLECRLSVDDLALALERALSNPRFLAEAGERGRRLVESKYLWPQIAARSISLYEQHRGRSSYAR